VWSAGVPSLMYTPCTCLRLSLIQTCMVCCVLCCAVSQPAEEPFELDGPCGVLAYLQNLLDERGHAVICVSEGAGQNLMYPGAYKPLYFVHGWNGNDVAGICSHSLMHVQPELNGRTLMYPGAHTLLYMLQCMSGMVWFGFMVWFGVQRIAQARTEPLVKLYPAAPSS
jgi:hypothetical protein